MVQIRRVFENNSEIFFSYFVKENIRCDTSSEPSQRDGSVSSYNVCFMANTVDSRSLDFGYLD